MSKEKIIQRVYNVAGPTLARFHASTAFVRVIRGPVRSGSSVACANEIFHLACNEKVQSDGVIRSRYAVIRNTYRELEDTTKKTWKDWFAEDIYGNIIKNDNTHYLNFNNGKQHIMCEVLFRALDTPDDIKKLLSLELTGAWFNEMREIPQEIFDTMRERVGQYPSKLDGGCRFPCIIGDTNSPATGHYLYELAEKIKPEGWEFFHQPGALLEKDGKFIPNPEAENVHNLNEGMDYYLKRLPGSKKNRIRVYFCNQYGFVAQGRPVHEEYNDESHCTKEFLEPVKGLPITVGIDFGLTPAACFGQKLASGRWIVFDEIVTERMGTKLFAEVLKAKINHAYKGFEFEFYGDPAGSQEAQTDQLSPFQILHAAGIPAEPAYHNNDPIIRREALDAPLTRMVDGVPGFLLSPKCDVLRNALRGEYCFKRLKISGDTPMFKEKPDKNKFSHIAEACEYMMLGAGEGAALIKVKRGPELVETEYMHTRPGHAQGWML